MKKEFGLLEIVEATFQPRRTDDLVDGVSKWIGTFGKWQCYGEITWGKYKGQLRMQPYKWDPIPQEFVWIPLEDLADIKSLNRTWID